MDSGTGRLTALPRGHERKPDADPRAAATRLAVHRAPDDASVPRPAGWLGRGERAEGRSGVQVAGPRPCGVSKPAASTDVGSPRVCSRSRTGSSTAADRLSSSAAPRSLVRMPRRCAKVRSAASTSRLGRRSQSRRRPSGGSGIPVGRRKHGERRIRSPETVGTTRR